MQGFLFLTIQSTLFSAKSFQEKVYDLSLTADIYGKQTIVYSINANEHEKIVFRDILHSYFKLNRNKAIRLLEINPNTSIDEFIYKKRIENSKYLVQEFYIGLELKIFTNQIENTVYYSSLAYHSPAVALAELNSILYAIYSKTPHAWIETINSPIKTDSKSSLIDISTTEGKILRCFEMPPFTILDIITSIIVAFILSLSTVNLIREKKNGSKSLQLMSGVHVLTYWFANYLFDILAFLFNICGMIAILKVLDFILNEKAYDITIIINDWTKLAYFCLLLVISSVSWATLSYIWSFFINSDIVGFFVLFIALSVAVLVDIVLVIIRQMIAMNNSSKGKKGNFKVFDTIRDILMLFFPNLAVKRGIYNLKIWKNDQCMQYYNTALGSKIISFK